MDNNQVRKIEKHLADKERHKKKSARPDQGTQTGLENFSYGAGKGSKYRPIDGWYSDEMSDRLKRIFGKDEEKTND